MDDKLIYSWDKNGIPLRAGDLIKVYHYTNRKNQRKYMYKLVYKNPKYDWLSAAHLGKETLNICKEKNSYRLDLGFLADVEIVCGHRYEKSGLNFEDREKIPESLWVTR